MARRKLTREGTLVLDSQGFSGLLHDSPRAVALVAEARRRGMDVVVCALTVIEAVHARTDRARVAWLLSGLRVVPAGEEEAKAASELLIGASLHGHKYAIDAAVAAIALRQQRPVAMLTSDVDDMTKLCGAQVRLIAG
ncbi:PIN domain-containing protein [Streptomyces sp. NPDC101115]|uniref:PIN domain-containing protein n=1 Tax=Streptomyces sp. NPDC101115 TaxID=3366106 RepID=UPI003816865A